jgi:hypothetical protein
VFCCCWLLITHLAYWHPARQCTRCIIINSKEWTMTDFWNGRFKVFMINMGHIMAVDRRFLHSMFQVLWLVQWHESISANQALISDLSTDCAAPAANYSWCHFLNIYARGEELEGVMNRTIVPTRGVSIRWSLCCGHRREQPHNCWLLDGSCCFKGQSGDQE